MGKEIKNIWRRFIQLYGYGMLAMILLDKILYGGNHIDISTGAIIFIPLAFYSALTSLIFYSKGDLSKKDWWCRQSICMVLNEVGALLGTYLAGLWRDLFGGLVVAVCVLVIAALMHVIEYRTDIATAKQLNETIRKRRMEASNENYSN
ncbi:MAG: hypothetical protein PUD20_11880 [bacterium]|nr:hypothetical protein [bacterium]